MRGILGASRWTIFALAIACGPDANGPAALPPAAARPSLLLVTLDTTRADAVAPEADPAATPHLAALAQRGLRFRQAYATAPATLPAHASMLTGLYPAGHGVHENGRPLAGDRTLLASRLADLGYATAAFVSGYPLERQFGLARGFTHFDDDFGPGGVERRAAATTDRALAWLDTSAPAGGAAPRPRRPSFVWVHFYDPHEPYDPPAELRARFPDDPYRGEIAAMDEALGRLIAGFERRLGAAGLVVLVAGDHGEARGDHGEALHGNLLYQGVMRVPLVLAGSGIAPGERSDPVSIRQVFATLLDVARAPTPGSLLKLEPGSEPVLAEAMQPHLHYRWQPQVMAIEGRLKVIQSGRLEVYDVIADPAEARDLAGEVAVGGALRRALRDYPLPMSDAAGAAAATGEGLDAESRRRLASLGYVAGEGSPAAGARPDAPRAADMTPLYADLDRGSRWFVEEQYARAIPAFERVLARDPGNLMVVVRLAVAHSLLGADRTALDRFAQAAAIDPKSAEVRHYLAMHHFDRGRWELAAPLFEAVLAAQPDRLAALERLARIRAGEGRRAEAIALGERAVALARDPLPTLLALGELRMGLGDTAGAISDFERARTLAGGAFAHQLELGVLYLAARRLEAARDALDQVPPGHPDFAMALFKRAQVSVLLAEPDRERRVRAAWEGADPMTRPLVENERLFAGLLPRRPG